MYNIPPLISGGLQDTKVSAACVNSAIVQQTGCARFEQGRLFLHLADRMMEDRLPLT